MATNLDEELLEQNEDDESDSLTQDELEQQEQYSRRFYLEQQQERARQKKAEQLKQLANAPKEIKKWSRRWKIASAIVGFFSAFWFPLVIALVFGGAFVVGCNNSLVFRTASLGACEPVIIDGLASSQTFSSGGGGGGGNVPPPTGSLTDQVARALLSADGISVNKNCVNQTSLVADPPGQTCLGGVQGATITEIIKFKDACNAVNTCVVVVTGGTELGHEGGTCSHGTGNKLDIRANANVDGYIENPTYFAHIANRSDGAIQYQNRTTNVIYARESDHWDIGGVGCA